MVYLIVRWVINSLILVLITYVVPGFNVQNFFVALISALVLAFLNAIIKPILIILTLPINIITLGLFTLIINGLLFWFMASFIKGLTITGFWPAFWAALVYSIISMFINWLLDKDGHLARE